MVAIGANPLFMVRQMGTTLQMIEEHDGSVRVVADELDELIATAGTHSRLPPLEIPLQLQRVEATHTARPES